MNTTHTDEENLDAAVFDAVVVGGGPVGAVMALGLRSRGLTVALIDPSPPRSVDNALGVDPRTLALSAATRTLLAQLNAWPDYPVSDIARMSIWEERGTAELAFDALSLSSAAAEEGLGHIIEVGPWRSFLWRQLDSAGVHLEIGAVTRLTDLAASTQSASQPPTSRRDVGGFAAQRWLVSVADRQLVAGLVIAADGANSMVRRSLSVPMPMVNTGQSALASAARTSLPHGRTAYQRFLHTGPLALLPLRDEHLVSVVWSADEAHADFLAGLSPVDLAAELTQATEKRLGVINTLLPAVRFPLRQGVVANFVPQPGVVLIGDAARVIHPLAGQGVNLGFEDVAGVLDCLAGDLSWPRFARARRARSQLVIQLMSTLNAAYGGPQPLLQWLRNQVVRGLNRSDRAKALLIREAMGLGPFAQAG